jgi:2,3-dihydroxyphenylpropionate 1,2-dioxygenase
VKQPEECEMTLKTICMSHSPFIGLVSPGEETERQVRAQLKRLADEVTAYRPELVLMLAPDHFNGFFYDMMPAFCVGARAESVGDYNSPPGPLSADENLAIRFVDAMSREGFDVNISYRMQVDHAFAQPLAALTGSLREYPVIPVFINAAAPPRPSMARVRRFGEAVGRFALSLDMKILLVGSGGLSHDPPVPAIATAPAEVQETLIAGRNPSPEARAMRQQRTLAAGKDFVAGKGNLRDLNEDWDRGFLAVIESGDLTRFDSYDDDAITRDGGRAAHEVRSWVAAFAAQSAAGPIKAQVVYQAPIRDWIVGMAMATAETA